MLRGMGDLIPSTVECDNGQASVQGMDSVFQSAPANIQARFQSAHDDIMNQFNNTWYTGINWIPFNTACQTIQQIGLKADALTQQIQSAMGQSGTPGAPAGALDLSTILIIVAVGYLAILALPSLISVSRK